MLVASLFAVSIACVYLYQDGIKPCPDGIRYTSRKVQPSPFNRRLTHWSPKVLTAVSLASWVLIAASLQTWQRAVMFMALPSVWLCVTRPTTVDGPAIALAWLSALLMPRFPALGMLVALVGGVIHERSPVFAAVYSMNPLPLIGLAVPYVLSSRGSPPSEGKGDADKFVGFRHVKDAIRAHKARQDLLSWESLVWPLRGVILLPALGFSWAGLAAWALSFASRVLATDTARCMIWAAPPLLVCVDPPLWLVIAHVASFRRMV